MYNLKAEFERLAEEEHPIAEEWAALHPVAQHLVVAMAERASLYMGRKPRRYLEAALMPMVARHKLLYAHALKRAASVDPQQTDKPEGRDVVELFFELRLDVLAKREAAAIIVANDKVEAEGFVTSLKAELQSLNEELKDRAATDADNRRRQWINVLIAYETFRAEHCRKLEAQIAESRSADAAAIERLQASQPATQPATQPAPNP